MDVSSDPLFSLSKFNGDVAGSALNAIGPTHWSRPYPLLPRTFIDVAPLDEQIIHIDVLRLLARIGNGGLHRLLNLARGSLVGKLQRHQGLADVLAANQIDDEPRLLWRHRDVPACCFADHSKTPASLLADPYLDGADAGVTALSFIALPPPALCPLNVRVGENSPSLWPTMFSVMYTGMNFFPL